MMGRRFEVDGIKPTAAMKRAFRARRHGQKLAPATRDAMLRDGLIQQQPSGHWRWTAKGRAVLRMFRQSEE
jgi:hypothetical protein